MISSNLFYWFKQLFGFLATVVSGIAFVIVFS